MKLDTGSQSVVSGESSVPTPGLGPLPPYDESPPGQSSAYSHQTTETDEDEFGTTVTEVTVTTTTVTTRKKYRVEGE